MVSNRNFEVNLMSWKRNTEYVKNVKIECSIDSKTRNGAIIMQPITFSNRNQDKIRISRQKMTQKTVSISFYCT